MYTGSDIWPARFEHQLLEGRCRSVFEPMSKQLDQKKTERACLQYQDSCQSIDDYVLEIVKVIVPVTFCPCNTLNSILRVKVLYNVAYPN